MNSGTPAFSKATSSVESAAALLASPTSTIDPARLFAAFSHPIRLKLMQMMGDGRMLSATEAAAVLKRDVDGINRNLVVLRDTGLVNCKTSEQDARFLLYYIPEAWRPQPGVLDFGFCVLQLSAIPDYTTGKRR